MTIDAKCKAAKAVCEKLRQWKQKTDRYDPTSGETVKELMLLLAEYVTLTTNSSRKEVLTMAVQTDKVAKVELSRRALVVIIEALIGVTSIKNAKVEKFRRRQLKKPHGLSNKRITRLVLDLINDYNEAFVAVVESTLSKSMSKSSRVREAEATGVWHACPDLDDLFS